MRITLKIKKYPELAGLSPEVIAVIVDEAVNEFLKSCKGIFHYNSDQLIAAPHITTFCNMNTDFFARA